MPGLYQDVLTFTKSERFNLTRNFYIGVWGDESSTFSIKYFTKAADGSIGIQKLMVGEKQSGILHPNLTSDQPSHLDHQPSLIYHF